MNRNMNIHMDDGKTPF